MLITLVLAAHISVPSAPAALMARHMEAIERVGWAHVVPGDLYHAHLVLSPRVAARTRFHSVEELFAGSAVILYHADEQLRRWRLDDGDLPTSEKRPRSIIGYPDGSIIPAASLFVDPEAELTHYSWYGTIRSDELAHTFPDRFLERRDWPVGDCTVNLIVDIYHQPDGVFRLTMDCR